MTTSSPPDEDGGSVGYLFSSDGDEEVSYVDDEMSLSDFHYDDPEDDPYLKWINSLHVGSSDVIDCQVF